LSFGIRDGVGPGCNELEAEGELAVALDADEADELAMSVAATRSVPQDGSCGSEPLVG